MALSKLLDHFSSLFKSLSVSFLSASSSEKDKFSAYLNLVRTNDGDYHKNLQQLLNDEKSLDDLFEKHDLKWPLNESEVFSQSGFVESLTEPQAAALIQYFNQ